MGNFAVTGSDTNTATETQMGVTGGTSGPVGIFFLTIGSVVTPADQAWEFYLQRYTAAGTSTAVTPTCLGPYDLTAQASAGVNHTVAPTLTANKYLLRIASNMRPAFVWVGLPDYMLWIPATASNGIALVSNATTAAAAYSYTMHFTE